MSLLMDALRKAEQQKQKMAAQERAGTAAQATSGLALEPLSPGQSETAPPPPPTSQFDLPHAPQSINLLEKSALSSLPELPTRLEDLDEQFMAHAAQPPLRTTPPSQAPEPPAPQPAPIARESTLEPTPESARKLFQAKQPAPKPNRKLAIAISIAALVAGIVIGGYIWWEMQPNQGGMFAGNMAKPSAPPHPSAMPAPPPVAAAATSTASGTSVKTGDNATSGAILPATPSSMQPAMVGDDDDVEEKHKGSIARKGLPPVGPVSPPLPKDELPVRVTGTTKSLDPAAELAYQAFNRGEFDLAQVLWKKVLVKDPRNSDALNGMAAVALQNRNPDQAAEYYLRALENNPKDALALSGLMSLKTPADALQAESRLKLLLAEQPDSPYLNLALGNLFARAARWAEAQEAFFRAHTADPTNPDYLFNLAVSLDRLHQSRLAAKYYGRALEAAARQPAGFDAGQVATRLTTLQSSLQQ